MNDDDPARAPTPPNVDEYWTDEADGFRRY